MSKPGTHADGFRWHKNAISGQSYSLENPDGHFVAHVWRGDNGWAVADHDGPLRASGLRAAWEGARIANNVWRPCVANGGGF